MKVGTDGVLLGAWADVSGIKKALDIGTGTGVVAIMLAQRAAEAEIHGVEIDELSCSQATENMQAVPWSERLKAFPLAVQDFARTTTERYDLIVSNPPFFTGGTFSQNQDRNSVRHTVKLPHGELLHAVRTLLKPQGRFCVILPYIEGLRFEELAKNYNFYCTRRMEVHPTPDKPVERLLLQFERTAREAVEKEELVIQQTSTTNDWTADYIALTGAFYLKM